MAKGQQKKLHVEENRVKRQHKTSESLRNVFLSFSALDQGPDHDEMETYFKAKLPSTTTKAC